MSDSDLAAILDDRRKKLRPLPTIGTRAPLRGRMPGQTMSSIAFWRRIEMTQVPEFGQNGLTLLQTLVLKDGYIHTFESRYNTLAKAAVGMPILSSRISLSINANPTVGILAAASYS